MNLMDALNTGSSGLSAQRVRMNIISSNLANVNTTRTPEGGPYRRQDVVFGSQFGKESFRRSLALKMKNKPMEVEVLGIINDTRPSLLKYDPSHPDADKKGYVALPNINLIEEMVNMISATRSFEACLTSISATKNMAQKALEIGK